MRILLPRMHLLVLLLSLVVVAIVAVAVVAVIVIVLVAVVVVKSCPGMVNIYRGSWLGSELVNTI